ncbi:MAG: hypothetical protein GWM93_01595, partial [Gemmatimonadetes bacterium]|nr:hypothetical protein [Gemmatimonadota bacterium]NIY33953.1 hypothetical protein [Gemmatimonadota bacterium]
PGKPLRPAARWTLVAVAALGFLAVASANLLTAALLSMTLVALWALHRFVLEGAARTFQDRVLPAVLEGYEKRLRWALSHRAVVLVGTVMAF